MGSFSHTINYWLSEHPSIINFRWSPSQSWGSTWSFLFSSITLYLTLAFSLNFILTLLRRRRPVPLGLIPAIHSLIMTLLSLLTFTGLSLSTLSEINETRWIWSRSKTPFQWLLCFPLGTRPTGRVFFWSYIFYLSRFLHVLRTFFSILQRKPLSLFHLFNHPFLICMSYLWLEFSQSFQVVAILSTTLVYSVVYGYRFWVSIGLPGLDWPVVLNAKIVLWCWNFIAHFGVLLLHFQKGGCEGIGAWVFNSVLNVGLLILFLNSYFQRKMEMGSVLGSDSIEAKRD